MAVPWFQAAQHASAFLGPVFKAAGFTAVGRARQQAGNNGAAAAPGTPATHQRSLSSKAVGGPVDVSSVTWSKGGGISGGGGPLVNPIVPPRRSRRPRHSSGLATSEVSADSEGTIEDDERILSELEQRDLQQQLQQQQQPKQQQQAMAQHVGASFGAGHRPPLPVQSFRASPARPAAPTLKFVPSDPSDALSAPAGTMVTQFTNSDEQNAAMQQAHAQMTETDRLLAEAARRHEELDDDYEDESAQEQWAPDYAASSVSSSSVVASSASAEDDLDSSDGQLTTMKEIASYFMSMPLPEVKEARPASVELREMDHDEATHFTTHSRESRDDWVLLLRINGAKHLYTEGFRVYESMKRAGIALDDEKIYSAMVSVCSARTNDHRENQRRIKQAYEFFHLLKERRGHVTEVFFNALSSCVAQLESVGAAENVIKLMNQHGVPPSCITYTALIKACRKSGSEADAKRAVHYFDIMQKGGVDLQPDTQAYNTMIRLCGERHNKASTEYAIKLFDEMREKHYQPDRHTYAALIHACSKSTDHFTASFEYFAAALAQGFKANVALYNILLSACAWGGKGDIANALRVWQMMADQKVPRNTVSFNTMLNVIAESMQGKGDHVPRTIVPEGQPQPPAEDGYSKEERIQMATSLYNQMKQEHIRIDLKTVNTRVKVNAKALRLSVTPKLQEELMAENGFTRDAVSYRTLVDMFITSQRFQLALDVIDSMHAAGFTPKHAQYIDMLNKLRLKKSLTREATEKMGEDIIQRMARDRMKPPVELARLFDPAKFTSMVRAKNAAAHLADTVKSGLAHSYSQRQDAMLRPSHKRSGSGRQGGQAERHKANPTLIKKADKREQRKADKKDKAQGIKPADRKQQAKNDGHIFERE